MASEDPKDELAGTEAPFISHLVELRDRLIRALAAVVVVFVVLCVWPGPAGLYDLLSAPMTPVEPLAPPPPVYKRPNKKWRLKRGATPMWFKQRQGIRRQAQSGAARVARFRPPRPR